MKIRPAAILAASLVLYLAVALTARAEVAVPTLTSAVTDLTDTLSAADRNSLETALRDFSKQKGSQVAVLIVPTTQPETIEQFSIRAAETWKLGRDKIDDGVLLLVAKNDRKVRIEVGYGLEGAIPDAIGKRIVEETILPKFKSGDFAGGIRDGVQVIIKLIDGEQLPQPRTSNRNPETDPVFLFFMTMVIGGGIGQILSTQLGKKAAGIVVGVLAALILAIALWWLLAVAFAVVLSLLVIYGKTNGHGSSWSTGSSSSGSSSSSGGSFSGGGGSFGGGGASGSW